MQVEFKQTLLKNNPNHLDDLTPNELQQHICQLRRRLSSISLAEPSNNQSTWTTSLILCNNTIGSGVMVLPLIFSHCGIINSLIILALIGIVQFVTCNLIVVHLKDNEPDLPEITERLLGKKWKAVFVISACLQEFLVGVVYLILMNNMLYLILIFIFEKSGFEDYAKKSENRYDIYSFQINAWLFFIPCYLSCFMKNLDYIAMLSKIGIYVLCAYIIFLFYILYDNFDSGNMSANISNFTYVTSNITEASGALSLAFFNHNLVCPLIKNIGKKEEGTKAVGISFGLTTLFYFLIGLVGYLGIIGRKTIDGNPQTIMDFFNQDSVFAFVIEILYFLKLLTVYPVFCYVSRSQFFALIYGDMTKEQEESHFTSKLVYNTIYIGIAMICVLFNVNLTFIMGLNGAVFGFILVYVIPIMIHFKCYGISPLWSLEKNSPNNNDKLERKGKKSCNQHNDKNKYSDCSRRLFYYGFIVLIGVYCLIIQLIAFFDFRWLASE